MNTCCETMQNSPFAGKNSKLSCFIMWMFGFFFKKGIKRLCELAYQDLVSYGKTLVRNSFNCYDLVNILNKKIICYNLYSSLLLPNCVASV